MGFRLEEGILSGCHHFTSGMYFNNMILQKAPKCMYVF